MFRFQAKKAFLTYVKCNLEPTYLLQGLQALFPDNIIIRYCIGQERHQDGDLHLHALAEYSDKITSRVARLFDIDGFHPNIHKVKNASDWKNCLQYCKKDGMFITNLKDTLSKRDQIMADLITEGQLTREFVIRNPSLLYSNLNNLRAWLRFLAPPPVIRMLPKKRHI